MLHFTPISNHHDATRLRALGKASEYGYTTGGEATHVAYTELGETVLMFAWRNPLPEDGPEVERYRFVLIFKDHHVDTFIQVSNAEQEAEARGEDPEDIDTGDDWVCPDEWELDESAMKPDGDSYRVETTVSLF